MLTHTWYLTGRKLHALVRQPWVIAFGVIQPAIWLFLFGALFHKVIDIPGFAYGGSYLAYLVPGVVAMNAMSGNMWAGMAMIEEIDRGTLNRFLVSPASRIAIMNATVAEQSVSTVVQTLIIVVLGYAGGARYPGGVAGIVVLTVAAVLVGVLWGALSNMVGMLLRSREAIIGIYTFFMLPLMFLSSAFMPAVLHARLDAGDRVPQPAELGGSDRPLRPVRQHRLGRGGRPRRRPARPGRALRGDLGHDVPFLRQERLTRLTPTTRTRPQPHHRPRFAPHPTNLTNPYRLARGATVSLVPDGGALGTERVPLGAPYDPKCTRSASSGPAHGPNGTRSRRYSSGPDGAHEGVRS